MKKNRVKNKLYKSLYIILVIVSLLFLLRFANPRELDDVTPNIPCEQDLYKKSDVLWVIPNFNETPISQNNSWCSYILSLNKTLGLHGITHQYEEFNKDRDQIYLDEGIKIFYECFGFEPNAFKPPQLKISDNNKALISSNNMKLKTQLNQITHKVYHCNDSDKIKNWMIDIF